VARGPEMSMLGEDSFGSSGSDPALRLARRNLGIDVVGWEKMAKLSQSRCDPTMGASGVIVKNSRWAPPIVVSLALSLLLLFLSHALTMGHLSENTFNVRAIIHGEPLLLDGQRVIVHPFYNRILFPAMFEGLSAFLHEWTDVQVLLIARFVSFAVCLFLIFMAVRMRHEFLRSFLVVAILTLAYIPTLSYRSMHPDDIFDLTLCFFLFLFLTEGRYWLALVVACLTSVNRETGPFGAIAYAALLFGKERMTVLARRFGAMLVLPYLGAITVRKIVLGNALSSTSTGQWIMGFVYNFNELIYAIRHPSPTSWLALLMPMMLLPFVFFFASVREAERRLRTTIAFAGIFTITSFVGGITEIRIYIPCIALLIACAVQGVEQVDEEKVA
jgi:hypothetical protein